MKWLAVLLLIALPASAQNPPLEGLQTYGCAIQFEKPKEGAVSGDWLLEVHAEYANGAEWKLQLSHDASVDKAVRRCTKWMHAVEKKTKPKAQPK